MAFFLLPGKIIDSFLLFQLVNDTSGVVGGVTVWPPEVLERDSSK